MTNFETRLIAGLERHQYDINAQAHRVVDERKQVAVGAVEHRTRTDETITSVRSRCRKVDK